MYNCHQGIQKFPFRIIWLMSNPLISRAWVALFLNQRAFYRIRDDREM